jgi:hypothetical protein
MKTFKDLNEIEQKFYKTLYENTAEFKINNNITNEEVCRTIGVFLNRWKRGQ